jgi:hypothetical protein
MYDFRRDSEGWVVGGGGEGGGISESGVPNAPVWRRDVPFPDDLWALG